MEHLTNSQLRQEMKHHGYLVGCAWQRDDVIGVVEEKDLNFTESDIDAIVADIERFFDASIGINWEVIEVYVDDHFSKVLN